ncbi:MAG TPA: Obg family GTPase CgtA, partial [Candidatus Stercoripulliclostridium merdigallinarum]|nr:Obg family GTPase CgtA [Candidatus Stercoripulliclostridium merdigallinarum]
FVITGGYIEELSRRVVLSDGDSFRWFQRALRDKGVIKALKDAGVKDGDTVRIMDVEFEYYD